VYGRTKLMCEQIIKDLCTKYKKKYFIFRYFNLAGASYYGENHDPETHLIPCVINNILKEKSVLIYGNKYNTVDGTCIRDFVHIADVVDAHIKVIKNYNNLNSFVINLGTSAGTSVMDVVNMCYKVSNQSPNIVIANNRPGDPDSLICDNTKAKSILGWEPVYNIEDIIKSDYNYRRKLV
jgi:UDP-glucose 4-epimerase